MSRIVAKASFAVIVFAMLEVFTVMATADEPPPRDATKFDSLKFKAEHGSVQQEIELATAYFTGDGVSQSNSQAAFWYEKAAEAGDAAAQNFMGYLYQAGIGVPADIARAVHWYQLSAAGGLAVGKVNLGVVYLTGNGVTKDTAMAERLFREAVAMGSGTAATYLGDLYFFGLGQPQNTSIAESWYRTGAKLHDAPAEYRIGTLYSLTPNHLHDIHKAVDMMRLASSRGFVPAMHSLGMLLVNHPEFAHSAQEAPALLETAANAGSWKSSILLGIIARDGKGVPADPKSAFYHFQVALLQGGAEAQKMLANDLAVLEPQLPSDTRSALQSSAGSWYERHHLQLTYIGKGEKVRHNFPSVAVAAPHADSHIGEIVPLSAFRDDVPANFESTPCGQRGKACSHP